MKISQLKINPNNPQSIKNEDYILLKYKILAYPNILKGRGIVYDSSNKNMILGGNKRFQIIKDISTISKGHLDKLLNESKKRFKGEQSKSKEIFLNIIETKEIPTDWLFDCKDWSEDEKKSFIVIDNVSDGEWDIQKLQEQWNIESLKNWGVIEWENKTEEVYVSHKDLPVSTENLANIKKDLLEIDYQKDTNEQKEKTIDNSNSNTEPKITQAGYSLFSIVLPHNDKLNFVKLLREIKDKEGFDSLSNSIVFIIDKINAL